MARRPRALSWRGGAVDTIVDGGRDTSIAAILTATTLRAVVSSLDARTRGCFVKRRVGKRRGGSFPLWAETV